MFLHQFNLNGIAFSRNSRKPTQALILGISATLLGAVGYAADNTRFTLTAYSNALGGQEILSGNYKAALSRINRAYVSQVDAPSVNLNRCVALTLTADWPAAKVACDAAVRAAEGAMWAAPPSSLQERSQQNETLAIAYTNRAILKWLMTDAKAAGADMAHAKSLLPDSAVVAQNVLALGAHSTVAQVRSAEQR